MASAFDDATGNGRKHPRTAMFVAATLRAGGRAFPVRIRNVSDHGALVEGGILPPAGTAVELLRAELRTSGTVAWVSGGRGGLALDGHLVAASWMTGKGGDHQQRVDERVALARRCPVDQPTPSPPPAFDAATGDDGAAIEEVVAQLGTLGDRLAGDDAIVARHSTALQAIDEVQQRLMGIARRLRG